MTALALDAYQTAAIWLILATVVGLFLAAMICHTGRRMDEEISVMLGDHYDDDPLTEYERTNQWSESGATTLLAVLLPTGLFVVGAIWVAVSAR